MLFVSQVYELINYSEHGTLVDNTIYALEYDGIKIPSKAALKKKMKAATSMGDRNSNSSSEQYKMSDMPNGYKPCHCSTSMAKVMTKREGTETSAIVQHGSYIRIGCLQFVFSIMEYHGGISLEERKEKEKEERIKKAQKEREEKKKKEKDEAERVKREAKEKKEDAGGGEVKDELMGEEDKKAAKEVEMKKTTVPEENGISDEKKTV